MIVANEVSVLLKHTPMSRRGHHSSYALCEQPDCSVTKCSVNKVCEGSKGVKPVSRGIRGVVPLGTVRNNTQLIRLPMPIPFLELYEPFVITEYTGII
jgi:hypothetical protein